MKTVRRRLSTKLQATYLLVILIFLLIAGLYLHYSLKRFYIDRKAEDLARRASLIIQNVELPEPGLHRDALARRLKEASGTRVTFVGPDGRVWADSDEESRVMENHLYRPEIQQALAGPRGRSIRLSETVGEEFLYVAVPARRDGELRGFVRLALPLTELNSALKSVRNRFLLAFLAASAIALVIGYAFSRSITRQIESITRFVRDLAKGRFGERLPVVSRDEVGGLASQLNSMADELERTIELINQEKVKVETILKSLKDAILVVDEGGEILSANPEASVLFGLTEAGLVGRSLTEVFRNPALDELFQEARGKRRSSKGPVSLATPRSKELEMTVVPMEEEAAPGAPAQRFVVAAHDLTQMRRLEKMRVDFIANVSHELRSPLTAIRGFIETLQDGAITDLPAAERFLEIASAQADRLTRLLDDLLTLSNIELGKVKLELKAVSLAEVVAECFSALEPKAANGSVSLETRGLEVAPPALADRDRLMQILINLVDNAIKFTPPGGSVTVSARPVPSGEAEEGPAVELLVADTGIGIPKEDLPRISERFYRVDKARSRELGGTGLGLAIVKHLVIAHGGSLALESEVGRGTTVKVLLPQAT